MDEAASWIALITLATSFVGAGLGTIVTLAFARRSATEQAMGEEWAKLRTALIERLASATSWVASDMDETETSGAARNQHGKSYEEVMQEFAWLMSHADLYLTENLVVQLRPYASWSPEEHRPTANGHYFELRRMLADAMHGAHARLPKRRFGRLA